MSEQPKETKEERNRRRSYFLYVLISKLTIYFLLFLSITVGIIIPIIVNQTIGLYDIFLIIMLISMAGIFIYARKKRGNVGDKKIES